MVVVESVVAKLSAGSIRFFGLTIRPNRLWLAGALIFLAIAFVIAAVRHYAAVTVDVLQCTTSNFGVYIAADKEDQPRFAAGGPWIEGMYTYLFDADFASEIRHLPGVKHATPYFLVRKIERPSDVIIGGIEPADSSTGNTIAGPSQIRSGRYLDATDTNAVMMEESYSKKIHRAVNDSLKVWGTTFKIIGIINSGIRPGKANVYAPLFRVRELLHSDTSCACANRTKCAVKSNDINVLFIETAAGSDQKAVLSMVRKTIGSSAISCFNCSVAGNSLFNRLLKRYQCCESGSAQ
jgi:putative ABC transport system permease protein